MPIVTDFTIAASAKQLVLPDEPDARFFIAFLSSTDPTTLQSWCPDVRAALPHIHAAFSASNTPDLAIVEVGQRPEWRTPGNFVRVNWNVHNVPTLVRFQRVGGEIAETGRLVEDEILDKKKLKSLVTEL
ncbi:hypothetical protein BP5796_12085 [Coleophoma crateriformis]|uniref:Thioredoxin domain-containing protein n=1 Tax=Coleophoma crateriformis TaxID=565419 RepID=A0A3D8QBQ6_9HELO|nr:hypothetical protein BP5796_12085 [Coleophoma crateriformis]